MLRVRVELLCKETILPFAEGHLWYVYVPKIAKGYDASHNLEVFLLQQNEYHFLIIFSHRQNY